MLLVERITALHFAAEFGHVDVAIVLIQNGVDVRAVTNIKWTALHCAAENGSVDVVKVLVQNGADMNALNCDSKTALGVAATQYGVTVRQVCCVLQRLVLVLESTRRQSMEI